MLILCAGCASTPQQPIQLAPSKLTAGDKVGIVMTAVPDSRMTYPGASCLLCLAAAAAANSSVSAHSKTFGTDDLKSLKSIVKHRLQSQGVEVVVIDTPVNLKKLPKLKNSKDLNRSRYSFEKYKKSHGITHLAFIDINFAGLSRAYSAYIPTSAPQAAISGVTYMVDLETHTYLLYHPISQYLFANGEWKQKGSYENLSNAYYQAVENVRDGMATKYTAAATN